jgi:diaminopimelate decarboxylase
LCAWSPTLNHFHIHQGQLWCEGVALDAIAASAGTPTFVYSTATLVHHFQVYRDAFQWGGGVVAYAVKANGNLSVLKTLARAGAGADTVSEGEIRRALAAGIDPSRIVFSGMGKTDAELAFALTLPGLQINVESAVELARLTRLAGAASARPIVVLRINPDVAAGGHDKISTGRKADKFGMPADEALALYAQGVSDGVVQMAGLACHIGSQIADPNPFEAAFAKMRTYVETLRRQGHEVSRLDLGGGLAAPYFEDGAEAVGLTPAGLGALAQRIVGDLGLEVSVEPGRAIAANAGVLLSRAVHVNERLGGPRFLVLDAAMNDLIRPSLYDAFHHIQPVAVRAGEPQVYEVVGPVCESGDAFAKGRTLPPIEAGDLVAIMSAGAYGAAMGSEYNSRPLAAEVLVDGDRWAIVRPRPTFEQMLAREPMADWLG